MNKKVSFYPKVFFLRVALVSLTILIFVFNDTYSQKIFTTKKGEVIAQSKYYDTVIAVKSNDLFMQMDYEKAKLKMFVNLNSFNSNFDSIDVRLKAISSNQISFDGKLGIDLINTQQHSPQNFNITGYVKYGTAKVMINGKGTLTHIVSNGEIASCILWLEFTFNTKRFLWNLPSYGISETITVQIIQAVLNKS